MNNIESQIEKLRNREEPYVGMPLPNLGQNRNHHRDMDHCDPMDRCDHNMEYPKDGDMHKDPLSGLPLAMAYVPWQCWRKTYEAAEGWHRGTIFPELDLPFLGGGMR